MKATKFHSVLILLAFTAGFLTVILRSPQPWERIEKETGSPGNALKSFEWWYSQRAWPNDLIPEGAFQHAFRSLQVLRKSGQTPITAGNTVLPWHSLGPVNIGGRTLAIAVNRQHPEIVWAGSASGGLWKSTSGGVGFNAWSYVNTGFNTISVSAIAIDPVTPSNLYIGTGEISLYQRPLIGTPGARASYGMGILRSTNNGTTWSQTGLIFSFPQITAVQKIAINPKNPQTVFAATSEGVFRSTNRGTDWSRSDTVLMAMDIVINPLDTTILYASHGNLNSSPNPGLYRSTDAGGSWQRMTSGLPSSDFGRTALAISASDPSVVYAGIANASTDRAIGLYKTTDNGNTWFAATSSDYISSQGWYNNALAVSPTNPDTLFCGGIVVYRSVSGGTDISTIPTSMVHVDQHALVFDPTDSRVLYIGCDGGIFKTTDGGETFLNLNNGYVTTQFYPGFANSETDSNIALGGLQDNGTLLYTGSPYWQQVNINDGGWCAIDPLDPDIQYSEYQYMALTRTTNRWSGSTWIISGLPITGPGGGETNFNFIPPFVLAPASPSVLYAGAKNVYRTTNRGNSWYAPNGGTDLNGTKIACIGVSRGSEDTLMAATGSGALHDPSPLIDVFCSTNGGQTWIQRTGSLPNRYPTDIEFDPSDDRAAYITFSGYGSPHIYHTTDLGLNWTNISSNLPDIPHQSVTIDPEATENLYVGTDLGVFHSSDRGNSWEIFDEGMPPAMVLDVTISRSNQSLRASTFGNGIYERQLLRQPVFKLLDPAGGATLVAGTDVPIRWSSRFVDNVTIHYSSDDGQTWTTIGDTVSAPGGFFTWTVPGIPTSQGRLRILRTSDGLILDSTTSAFSVLVDPDYLAGWNLISLSQHVADARVKTVFPAALSQAFLYNYRYLPVDTLVNGTGYWVKLPAAQFFHMTGDTIRCDTVPVRAGWNIIGTVTMPVSVSDILSVPDNNITSYFFGYRNSYTITDSLRPNNGYWVKVRSSGSLIVGRSAGRQSTEVFRIGSSLNRLTISDAVGHSQTLLIGTPRNTESPKLFELPPPLPEDAFDARFSSGRMLAILPDGEMKKGDAMILVKSSDTVLYLNWQQRSTDVVYSVSDISGTSFPLTGNCTIRLKAGTIRIRTDNEDQAKKPQVPVLGQNYPNPFNPRTEIRYYIPDKARIRISIYSITGQVIEVLTHGEQEAGNHILSWDGSRYSSGIYFCRLETGKSNSTIKMILVK